MIKSTVKLIGKLINQIIWAVGMGFIVLVSSITLATYIGVI